VISSSPRGQVRKHSRDEDVKGLINFQEDELVIKNISDYILGGFIPKTSAILFKKWISVSSIL